MDRALVAAIRAHVARFFDRAKQFVREAIVAGLLVFGEPTATDLNAAQQMADVQGQFFDAFHREVQLNPPIALADLATETVVIQPPPMSAAQFVARAESYGGSVWAVQNIIRAKDQPPGTLEARFHLRPPGHHECKTCINESLKGWVPVGTLNPIGDSECRGNCDCFFSFKHPNTKIIWVVGEKLPKGLAA